MYVSLKTLQIIKIIGVIALLILGVLVLTSENVINFQTI